MKDVHKMIGELLDTMKDKAVSIGAIEFNEESDFGPKKETEGRCQSRGRQCR
jgi:hypothetical protein